MKSLLLTLAAGAMALGLAFAQSGNQAPAPRAQNQNQNQTCPRCGAQCACPNAGVCPMAGGQAAGRGPMRGMMRGRAMAGRMQCMTPGAATNTPASQPAPKK